jgi:hypothetical protein
MRLLRPLERRGRLQGPRSDIPLETLIPLKTI